MPAVTKYLQEVREELRNVIWPKREEVVKLTLIVITISAVVGVFLGGLDYIFTKGLELIVL